MTRLTIQNNQFYIDGKITHAGTKLEGLLPNSRMVQAIFDDKNPSTLTKWVYSDTKQWDAERNVREFIAQLKEYRKCGVLALTVNLQGGGPLNTFPTPQPHKNSGIWSDGTLDSDYLSRLDRVIQAMDALGMVCILGIFYFGQAHLVAEKSIPAAITNVCMYLLRQNYTNVMLEICNESSTGHYKYPLLQPAGIPHCLQIARNLVGGKIPISCSFNGGVVPPDAVLNLSDYILLHGNSQSASGITSMIKSVRGKTSKPIIFNEDSVNLANYADAVSGKASWGYYDQSGFQSPPVNWSIQTKNKQAFFGQVLKDAGTQSVPTPTPTPTPTQQTLTLTPDQISSFLIFHKN